jgi:glycosyltransferase involved in cell wall biosynthesis
MNYPLDLTIALPIKNEENTLSQCLATIGSDFAKHIVVIDSGSTDHTLEIAREWNTGIINFAWNGKFPKKRNWFLQNYPLQTKWVLFLDADEYLTEDFKKEVRQKLSRDDKDGYWLSYTVYFLGKGLKGGYPFRKLALFRVGAGEFERIDEENWSGMDIEVHEHPLIKGKVGTIYNKIDHRDMRGISNYVIKHKEYASWEAARFLKTTRTPGISKQWTWKQKIKYRLMPSVLIGPAYFLGTYLFYGGFRDGSRGLAFALLKMGYFTQIYCKIKESIKEPVHQPFAPLYSTASDGLSAIESLPSEP